jgi:hypothetical protein
MKLKLDTYAGHAINDGTNYIAALADKPQKLAEAQPLALERAGEFPALAGKRLSGLELELGVWMQGDPRSQQADLKVWFDVRRATLERLTAIDENDSNSLWYLEVTPLRMQFQERRALITLYAPEPLWRRAAYGQAGRTISASGQSLIVNMGGRLPVAPRITLTALNPKSGAAGYKRQVMVVNPGARAFSNYPLDITGGGIDMAALVSAGKCQADGDDLRVMVDGSETPRWLGNPNSAHTTLWISLDLAAGKTFKLKNAISAGGAVNEIVVQAVSGCERDLKKLAGSGVVLIDSEAFIYTQVAVKQHRLKGVTRAANGTAAAAHAAGAAVRLAQHDIWLQYGNTQLEAPPAGEAAPLLDLTASSNSAWVYTAFMEENRERPAAWKPAVIASKGKRSKTYEAAHAADAALAAVMGLSLVSYQNGVRAQAENGEVEWRLNHPAGVIQASSSGAKYRQSGSFPAVTALQRSLDGRKWTTVWNEASPTAAAAWETWQRSAAALGGSYPQVRFALDGAIGAAAGNCAHFEVHSLTLKLDETGIPQVSLGAEQQNYYLLAATLRNQTSGKALRIQYLAGLNQPLVIDCARRAAEYQGANALAGVALDSNRPDWLDLLPGENILIYEEEGVSSVNLLIEWQETSL